MALIDFHCHLDLYPDPHAVAREAARRGVYVLSVTTTPTAFEGTQALAPSDSRIRTALGLHPELAAARKHELSIFEKLLPRTGYVGEVGLDGSRPHRETLETQMGVLLDILLLCARAGGKTISLHSREARKPLLDLLGLEPEAGRFILHWFTGSPKEVSQAAEMGCWFSVGTAMTMSASGRKAVSAMPRERVLPETDGPFGNLQGRAAFPWEAMGVSVVLADIWDLSPNEAASILAANFRQISRQSSPGLTVR